MRALAIPLLLAVGPAWGAERDVAWSEVVGGPHEATPPIAGPTAALYARCGARSLALEALAANLAAAGASPAARPTPRALGMAVQAAGGTTPWPRAWSYTGSAAGARERFDAWLVAPRGVRRCGIAHAVEADGRATFAALTVDELAEVAPLARRVRVGAWVSLDATLRLEARDVAVVLLGPDGSPRRVPSNLHEGRVRANFALDGEGAWTAQLVATLDGGPEPVAELRLLAGRATDLSGTSASDEGDATPSRTDDRVLYARLEAARSERGLGRLARSEALETLALEHAREMARQGRVAHDVGEGGPVERTRARGIEARSVGENVARASDVAAAHGALWESPSHRDNMLSRRFRRVGIGVHRDPRGVWVTELFAD